MVIFNDNELEIAVVTYNRLAYMKQWMALCYDEIIKRNISLSVFDSSTDDETKNYIINNFGLKVKYYQVDSITSVGYKPMYAILNSNHKYLWVCGDSRYHDFKQLDNTFFTAMKNDLDYILISAGYNNEYDSQIFYDKTKFIDKCFISSTCIGLSAFKTNIFKSLKNDAKLLHELDLKYKNNYGFAWMGYFYECFAKKELAAIYFNVDVKDVIKKEKKQFWASRFYECWVENLCSIADNLPNCYVTKHNIPRMVWMDMHLDSIMFCCKARIANGLNPKILKKYIANGLLKRVSNRTSRITFFAYCPKIIVKLIYKLYVFLKNHKY